MFLSEARAVAGRPSASVPMTLVLLPGCLQVHTHTSGSACPKVTLRMTSKLSVDPTGSLLNPHSGLALSQMFPSPLGDLVRPPWVLLNHPMPVKLKDLSQNIAEIPMCPFCLSCKGSLVL
jgi:hypothetical protein